MRGDLLPTIGTGALLLILGAAFLGLGAIVFAASPAAMSLWVLLLGLLLLGSGLVAAVLAPRVAPGAEPFAPAPPAAAAEAPPTRAPPSRTGPGPTASPSALAAPRAVERAAALARPAGGGRSLSSSIPGAYLQSISPGLDLAQWSTPPPPIAAALPFSAGVPRPGAEEPPDPSGKEAPPEAILELELARLRARVRELESPRPSGVAPATSVARSGATTSLPRPGAEPPAPPSRPSVGARGCAGCGSALATGRSPLLCWGCGRALCAGCFWRYGPGPGLHRCPDCLEKAAHGPDLSAAVSGGRATVTPARVPVAGPAGARPPPTGGR